MLPSAVVETPSELPPPSRFPQSTRFPMSVRAQVDINASRQRVWEVLTDFDSYPQWNPFTASVQGSLQDGAAVTMQVHMLQRRPRTQVEYVNSVVQGHRICWGMEMGTATLLTANRLQTLEAIDEHTTRYVTDDLLSGWLTPIVRTLYGDKMQRGFDAMASALKVRAEASD